MLQTIILSKSKIEIRYEQVQHLRTQGLPAHKVFDIFVDGLSEDLEIPLDLGELGVPTALLHLSPQPIGEHFSVVWNGDYLAPKLKFDGAPAMNAHVRIEVWGA